MDKELTLEEAEKIVDNMYQNRWKECGIEDGNTIHMGNLDKLHYNEFERASILLLRTEIRLKRENQELKKQQKEFIAYLKNEKDRLAREVSFIYEDGLGTARLVNGDIFEEVNEILLKYKEIIGVKDE